MQISVTLRVSGDHLIPEEISTILHVTPHVARRKGAIKISPSGKKIIAKFGLWTWKSEDSSETSSIDDHINRLQAAFAHSYALLGNLPNAENTWVDICIIKSEADRGDAHAEFLLGVTSVEILRQIGLPVEFTIY